MRLPQGMFASLMSRNGTEISLPGAGLLKAYPPFIRFGAVVSSYAIPGGSLCTIGYIPVYHRLVTRERLPSRFVPDRLHDKMTPIGDIRKAAP